MGYKIFFLLVTILTFSSCQDKLTDEPFEYLFLGHAYDWLVEDKLDPRLELLDYSAFENIWLGGDICARSSKSESTLIYLDSIFDLSKPGTHWAIGNHDLMDGDEQKINSFTQRPSYYSYAKNELQILVLNTNLFWHNEWSPPIENCEKKEAQMAFIQHFCDTLSSTKNLVILHHHGIFNEKKLNTYGYRLTPDNVNAVPIRSRCAPESNLYLEWYPSLVKLQQKGIQVTCIAGDVGMNQKKYHFTTQEGIHLLGSGINNSMNMDTPAPYVKNFNPDSVLIIKHWPKADSLSWDFVRLTDLVLKQNPSSQLNQMSPRMKDLLEKY